MHWKISVKNVAEKKIIQEEKWKADFNNLIYWICFYIYNNNDYGMC